MSGGAVGGEAVGGEADPHAIGLYRDAEAYRAGEIGEGSMARSRRRALRRAVYALAERPGGQDWRVARVESADGSWAVVLSVEERTACG